MKFFGLKRNFFFFKVAFFRLQHLALQKKRVTWELERHRRHTEKLQNVLVQTLKPRTKPFFDVFWWETLFFATKKPFSLVQHLVRPIKRLYREFYYHRIHTVKSRTVLVQTWKPQQPNFWKFLGPIRIFSLKISIFYFHHILYFKNYRSFVSLSFIGVKQSKSGAFWCRPENRKKPPSSDVLRPKMQFSSL